jgi:hypothetical protein
MKIKIVAPAPDDLTTGQKKGAFISWGLLRIHSYSYDTRDPGNVSGLWSWQPFPEIANIDTFWGYIRDDFLVDVKTVARGWTPYDSLERAEGSLQIQPSQLILSADRPKKRTAMLLWGFEQHKDDPGTSGYGIFYRGNTVHRYEQGVVEILKLLERTDGSIESLRWTVIWD